MPPSRCALLLLTAVLIAACSSAPTKTYQRTLEGQSAALPPPAAGTTWTTTYPYGTARPRSDPATAASPPAAEAPPATSASTVAAMPPEAAAPVEEAEATTVFRLPDGQEWINPGYTEDKRQADLEACYRYAWGQVEHDRRIESDVEAARDDRDQGLGFDQLTQRMSAFEQRNRRSTLFQECMEAKGYTRG